MKNIIKITMMAIIGILFNINSIIAQEHDSTSAHHKMDHDKMMKDGKMMCDSTMMKNHKNMGHKGMMDHSKMMKDGEHKMGNSMVHEGIIDINAVDKNGDKKVFQDQMDWNVISDEPGSCPMCGMKLKEVSIYEAKTKLITNGFKVK